METTYIPCKYTVPISPRGPEYVHTVSAGRINKYRGGQCTLYSIYIQLRHGQTGSPLGATCCLEKSREESHCRSLEANKKGSRRFSSQATSGGLYKKSRRAGERKLSDKHGNRRFTPSRNRGSILEKGMGISKLYKHGNRRFTPSRNRGCILEKGEGNKELVGFLPLQKTEDVFQRSGIGIGIFYLSIKIIHLLQK